MSNSGRGNGSINAVRGVLKILSSEADGHVSRIFPKLIHRVQSQMLTHWTIACVGAQAGLRAIELERLTEQGTQTMNAADLLALVSSPDTFFDSILVSDGHIDLGLFDGWLAFLEGPHSLLIDVAKELKRVEFIEGSFANIMRSWA